MKLLFLLLALTLVSVRGLSGQRLSSRSGTYFEVGAGVGRLAERTCASCSGSHRSLGPALLLRMSQRLGRAFELGGELQATRSGGRHFEAGLLTAALVSASEYAAWLRMGGGLLLYPGEGDDVTVTAGEGSRQDGSELGAGIILGVGLDVPLGNNRSFTPQASYVRHLGAERRFNLLMIGASIRLF